MTKPTGGFNSEESKGKAFKKMKCCARLELSASFALRAIAKMHYGDAAVLNVSKHAFSDVQQFTMEAHVLGRWGMILRSGGARGMNGANPHRADGSLFVGSVMLCPRWTSRGACAYMHYLGCRAQSRRLSGATIRSCF